MNQFEVVIEDGLSEVNPFGIQLEEPMSNDVSKSLHTKILGNFTDAFSHYS